MSATSIHTDFLLSEDVLDETAAVAFLRSVQSGAEVVFTGVVRDTSQDRQVVHLDFEAYPAMVNREWTRMTEEASARWPLHSVMMHHRTGTVWPGETAVICAVSAARRSDAFAACMWLMDELKRTVPIWKKEVFEDGSVWVAAHP